MAAAEKTIFHFRSCVFGDAGSGKSSLLRALAIDALPPSFTGETAQSTVEQPTNNPTSSKISPNDLGFPTTISFLSHGCLCTLQLTPFAHSVSAQAAALLGDTIIGPYAHGSYISIVLFDVRNRSSFQWATNLCTRLLEGNRLVVLVGTKCDSNSDDTTASNTSTQLSPPQTTPAASNSQTKTTSSSNPSLRAVTAAEAAQWTTSHRGRVLYREVSAQSGLHIAQLRVLLCDLSLALGLAQARVQERDEWRRLRAEAKEKGWWGRRSAGMVLTIVGKKEKLLLRQYAASLSAVGLWEDEEREREWEKICANAVTASVEETVTETVTQSTTQEPHEDHEDEEPSPASSKPISGPGNRSVLGTGVAAHPAMAVPRRTATNDRVSAASSTIEMGPFTSFSGSDGVSVAGGSLHPNSNGESVEIDVAALSAAPSRMASEIGSLGDGKSEQQRHDEDSAPQPTPCDGNCHDCSPLASLLTPFIRYLSSLSPSLSLFMLVLCFPLLLVTVAILLPGAAMKKLFAFSHTPASIVVTNMTSCSPSKDAHGADGCPPDSRCAKLSQDTIFASFVTSLWTKYSLVNFVTFLFVVVFPIVVCGIASQYSETYLNDIADWLRIVLGTWACVIICLALVAGVLEGTQVTTDDDTRIQGRQQRSVPPTPKTPGKSHPEKEKSKSGRKASKSGRETPHRKPLSPSMRARKSYNAGSNGDVEMAPLTLSPHPILLSHPSTQNTVHERSMQSRSKVAQRGVRLNPSVSYNAGKMDELSAGRSPSDVLIDEQQKTLYRTLYGDKSLASALNRRHHSHNLQFNNARQASYRVATIDEAETPTTNQQNSGLSSLFAPLPPPPSLPESFDADTADADAVAGADQGSHMSLDAVAAPLPFPRDDSSTSFNGSASIGDTASQMHPENGNLGISMDQLPEEPFFLSKSNALSVLPFSPIPEELLSPNPEFFDNHERNRKKKIHISDPSMIPYLVPEAQLLNATDVKLSQLIHKTHASLQRFQPASTEVDNVNKSAKNDALYVDELASQLGLTKDHLRLGRFSRAVSSFNLSGDNSDGDDKSGNNPASRNIAPSSSVIAPLYTIAPTLVEIAVNAVSRSTLRKYNDAQSRASATDQRQHSFSSAESTLITPLVIPPYAPVPLIPSTTASSPQWTATTPMSQRLARLPPLPSLIWQALPQMQAREVSAMLPFRSDILLCGSDSDTLDTLSDSPVSALAASALPRSHPSVSAATPPTHSLLSAPAVTYISSAFYRLLFLLGLAQSLALPLLLSPSSAPWMHTFAEAVFLIRYRHVAFGLAVGTVVFVVIVFTMQVCIDLYVFSALRRVETTPQPSATTSPSKPSSAAPKPSAFFALTIASTLTSPISAPSLSLPTLRHILRALTTALAPFVLVHLGLSMHYPDLETYHLASSFNTAPWASSSLVITAVSSICLAVYVTAAIVSSPALSLNAAMLKTYLHVFAGVLATKRLICNTWSQSVEKQVEEYTGLHANDAAAHTTIAPSSVGTAIGSHTHADAQSSLDSVSIVPVPLAAPPTLPMLLAQPLDAPQPHVSLDIALLTVSSANPSSSFCHTAPLPAPPTPAAPLPVVAVQLSKTKTTTDATKPRAMPLPPPTLRPRLISLSLLSLSLLSPALRSLQQSALLEHAGTTIASFLRSLAIIVVTLFLLAESDSTDGNPAKNTAALVTLLVPAFVALVLLLSRGATLIRIATQVKQSVKNHVVKLSRESAFAHLHAELTDIDNMDPIAVATSVPSANDIGSQASPATVKNSLLFTDTLTSISLLSNLFLSPHTPARMLELWGWLGLGISACCAQGFRVGHDVAFTITWVVVLVVCIAATFITDYLAAQSAKEEAKGHAARRTSMALGHAYDIASTMGKEVLATEKREEEAVSALLAAKIALDNARAVGFVESHAWSMEDIEAVMNRVRGNTVPEKDVDSGKNLDSELIAGGHGAEAVAVVRWVATETLRMADGKKTAVVEDNSSSNATDNAPISKQEVSKGLAPTIVNASNPKKTRGSVGPVTSTNVIPSGAMSSSSSQPSPTNTTGVNRASNDREVISGSTGQESARGSSANGKTGRHRKLSSASLSKLSAGEVDKAAVDLLQFLSDGARDHPEYWACAGHIHLPRDENSDAAFRAAEWRKTDRPGEEHEEELCGQLSQSLLVLDLSKIAAEQSSDVTVGSTNDPCSCQWCKIAVPLMKKEGLL